MEEPTQKLTLVDKKKLSVNGVQEIISFDESQVVLHTCLGTLRIQGQDLHLRSLCPDGGRVEVDGVIWEMSYEELKAPGGWFSRLFS